MCLNLLIIRRDVAASEKGRKYILLSRKQPTSTIHDIHWFLFVFERGIFRGGISCFGDRYKWGWLFNLYLKNIYERQLTLVDHTMQSNFIDIPLKEKRIWEAEERRSFGSHLWWYFCWFYPVRWMPLPSRMPMQTAIHVWTICFPGILMSISREA